MNQVNNDMMTIEQYEAQYKPNLDKLSTLMIDYPDAEDGTKMVSLVESVIAVDSEIRKSINGTHSYVQDLEKKLSLQSKLNDDLKTRNQDLFVKLSQLMDTTVSKIAPQEKPKLSLKEIGRMIDEM
jgi:hypothetical protein